MNNFVNSSSKEFYVYKIIFLHLFGLIRWYLLNTVDLTVVNLAANTSGTA